ncbi:hypothetical protein D3C80_1600190 [compost metagenome]
MKNLPLYLSLIFLFVGCKANLFKYNPSSSITLSPAPTQIKKEDIQEIYFYNGKQIELKQFNRLYKEKGAEITYLITDNADSLTKYNIRKKYLNIAYLKD